MGSTTKVELTTAIADCQSCAIPGEVEEGERRHHIPWLPVLAKIEPPALRRRAATDKLITQAECHRVWPLYDDLRVQ